MGNPRIALVGAGSMGSLHARVISQSERADLAYVVDSQREAGAPVAERFGTTWVPELDGATDVDAVVVAAVTEAHHALGLQVLRRGLPLLMEKPLADRLVDAEELVALSTEKDVPLMCGLLERYNPAIMTALSFVEHPQHVTAVRHSPYVPRIRTGASSDLLIHDIDSVLRLAGSEPSAVRGSFGYLHPDSPDRSEDVAEAMLGFPTGMVANISASRVSQRKVRHFAIAEANRLVEVDMLRNAVTIYRHVLNDAGPDGLSYKQQTIIEIPTLISAREPLAVQLDRFLDLATGALDAAGERASILPPHRTVQAVRDNAAA
ncbi:MAG: Gfo/Idh/MocA family protein [Jatrophihabitantaceae bacterium]